MTQTENLYLSIFRKWIEDLDNKEVRSLSLRGSFDEGWFDVEFELNNYTVYVLLNNDVVQIYDRYVCKIDSDKFFQETDAVVDFSPEQFKDDLKNLYESVKANNIIDYFKKTVTQDQV